MSRAIDTEEKALIATVAQFTSTVETISKTISDLQAERTFVSRPKTTSFDEYARIYIKRHKKGVLNYIDQHMNYATFLLNNTDVFSANSENLTELSLKMVDMVHADPLKYQFTPLGKFLLTKVDEDV